MKSNKEILIRLAKIESELDRQNRYIDSFCRNINDLVQRFKMRNDRIEDIEQSIADLESNIDNFYSSLKYLSASLDKIKNNTSEKLENAVSQLITDIQSELNDVSISPSKERSFPSIYDSEPGDVVLSVGVYPVRLEGVYENHDYTVIVGLALNNRIIK